MCRLAPDSDDRDGRVALPAKDAGAIPLVAPVLEELVVAGMRASDALLARALPLPGERPNKSP